MLQTYLRSSEKGDPFRDLSGFDDHTRNAPSPYVHDLNVCALSLAIAERLALEKEWTFTLCSSKPSGIW
jgi:HD-GYP domain-containing protein (c-di-GMP phosphodiesterase class II)